MVGANGQIGIVGGATESESGTMGRLMGKLGPRVGPRDWDSGWDRWTGTVGGARRPTGQWLGLVVWDSGCG